MNCCDNPEYGNVGEPFMDGIYTFQLTRCKNCGNERRVLADEILTSEVDAYNEGFRKAYDASWERNVRQNIICPKCDYFPLTMIEKVDQDNFEIDKIYCTNCNYILSKDETIEVSNKISISKDEMDLIEKEARMYMNYKVYGY